MNATLYRPDRVFDGRAMRAGWAVRVEGERIAACGPAPDVSPDDAAVVDLSGATLTPGLIDLHTHILLHPYAERSWDDQVLRDPEAYRAARAVPALAATLRAGFTTIRDLGTEGAGEADVALRRAVDEGIIPGPRILAVTRAIVARGFYGPGGFAPHVCVPLGAEEVDGPESIYATVRRQISRGADWIKVYADSRHGPGNLSRPSFSLDDLALIVRIAADSGVPVAAHAVTAEAMERAARAGVATIEHGNEGTRAVFDLMRDRGVAYVPTLAAYESIWQYRGLPSNDPAYAQKAQAFADARASGVTIANGSDIGVFPHGQNAHELELLVAAGMSPVDALTAATSTAAGVLRRPDIGTIEAGAVADLAAFDGDLEQNISVLRSVRTVVKGGQRFR